jgi:glycosyltransferase involved in cell wall biosynthesis
VSPKGDASRRLLVSAFGIHYGGGLVLLSALLAATQGRLRAILLDERLARSSLDAGGARVMYVRCSFRARLASLWRLSAMAAPGDVLLCFNSLPPLRRVRARVVTYVQAPHFVNAHRGIRYGLRTSLRIFLERLWFRRGIHRSDEIWVQTSTMADAIRRQHPHAKLSIVPLVDAELLAPRTLRSRNVAGNGAFFYPADTVGHKNHETLLRAWELLSSEGAAAPPLWLTIEPRELEELLERIGSSRELLPAVQALGRLDRSAVLQRLQQSSALIFPSLAETFGLPLVEAASLGIPIVASETDFVRDVCVPRETFDPRSARSIARAVGRFTGKGAVVDPALCSAEGFLERLLS